MVMSVLVLLVSARVVVLLLLYLLMFERYVPPSLLLPFPKLVLRLLVQPTVVLVPRSP